MTNYVIKMPAGWHYMNQFLPTKYAPNPSKQRCATATTAMATAFARPNEYNEEELEDHFYTKYDGPDIASDPQGTTFANLEKMLQEVRVGYVDLQPLIDMANSGNAGPLHAELQAMNRQNVPQIITVADESQLYDASNPQKKLHSWADQGMSHVIFRIGYSDSEGWGAYYEPAAPGFPQPVHIPWPNINSARVIHALGIMGPGINPPPNYGPGGFLYQTGTWPAPEPSKITISEEDADQLVTILRAATETQAKAVARFIEILGEK